MLNPMVPPKEDNLSYLWTVILCCLGGITLGQSNTIDLHTLHSIPHAYYSYSSSLIEHEIELVQEGSQAFTIAEILQTNLDWKTNDTDLEPEKGRVHWTRLTIQADRRDTVLLEFGMELHYTWDDIEYYVVHEDSIIAQGQSGSRFLPKDKPIRSAVNLAEFPVAQGLNVLYCKLKGFTKITDDPIWISRFGSLKKKVSFFIHDRSTYTIIDAFRFPGQYANSKRGHFFGTNYFKQSLEIFTDPTKGLKVDAVADNWDDYARFQYDVYPHPDSLYWMRLKVIGTEDGPGNYLFGPSTGSHWNFDTVEIYNRARGQKWNYQITGNAVDKDAKSIPSNWNLFRIKAPPQDTQFVFLKMSGAGKRFVPMFAINQFEEDTFWPRLFTVQWIYGGFYSILITTAIYFFILGYTEKRRVQFWFVGLIIGFGALLGFMGADVNYFVFTSLEAWHPWIAAAGGFFVIAGLYKYIQDYLSLDRIFGIQVSRIFNPLIIIHVLICINFGLQLHSIGGNIPIFENYFRIFIGSIVFNFLTALVIGVMMMYRGNLYARFFVIAFGSLLIILLVRLGFAFGSFSSTAGFNQSTIATGIFVHYLLFLGIALMIILLAFGNGYRINQLKKSAVDAALKSQEKELANNFLRQNNEEITRKANENALLVKEIHHRVKNNLQVLASLLNLQSDFINDDAAYKAIMESKARVEAMGMIHQLLYLGDSGVPSIDMSLYLDELCSYYEDSFISDDQDIKITHDIAVNHLDIDTAIPIGLTLTELVTNAKKHAFGDEKSGAIAIKLWINQSEQLCLEVSDNGVGEDQSSNGEGSKSFGTELIRILSKKLKGTITINNDDGYRTHICYDRFTHYPEPV